MSDQGPEAGELRQAAELRQTERTNGSQASAGSRSSALEAVLFMAAEPLPPAELADILGVTPGELEELILQLEAAYAGRGIQVTRLAGGYQVATRPEYGPYVAKLHKPERFRLSRAALETLAIVAYKQPATRPEIEAIRGVNSDSVLDTLSQYELVCEAGRKETPGRPLLYRTTSNFLGHFGLDSVADLPRLDAVAVDESENQAEAPEAPVDASQVQVDAPEAAHAPQDPVPSESSGSGASAPTDADGQPQP